MGCCLKSIKLDFEVIINIQSGVKWPLTTNCHFICNIYKPGYLQNRVSYGVLILTSSTFAARSPGIRSNFDWLR